MHAMILMTYTSNPGRNGKASRISSNYRREINQCFDNMRGETDTMLKLTSQKTSITFADNQIRKKQVGLEKMQMTADIATGEKLVADTHLSKLEGVNVKFKEKAKGSKNLVTPTKRPARKKRSSTEISPSPACYPYIEKGKTHTSFYLSEKKTILFTESDTQVPPRSIFLKRNCIPPEQ